MIQHMLAYSKLGYIVDVCNHKASAVDVDGFYITMTNPMTEKTEGAFVPYTFALKSQDEDKFYDNLFKGLKREVDMV